MIHQECQSSYRYNEKLNSEGVMIGVVGWFEVYIHQIDCGIGREDKEDFHGGVVNRDEGSEQV